MRLTVLGSNGGGPSRTNPGSGYLVEEAMTAVWLDAGPGTFMELARRIDPATLSAVVLSHIHVDHCSDVMGLYGYLAHGAPAGTVSVPVFVPDGAAAHLAAFARANAGHLFHRVFGFVTVGAGDTATVGGLSLSFEDAVHGIPALLTRIDAGGGSLVYSGDTGPGGNLAPLAAGCDAALLEASLGGEREPDQWPYHLTAGEAGAVARSAGVARLILTHLTPTLDEATALAEASAEYPGPVEVAVPGMVVAVGADDETGGA